jgi:hypothetical protein
MGQVATGRLSSGKHTRSMTFFLTSQLSSNSRRWQSWCCPGWLRLGNVGRNFGVPVVLGLSQGYRYVYLYIYISLSLALSLSLSLSLTVTASYNHYKTILIQALCLANGRYTMIDVPRTSALLVFPMHWTLEQDANVGFKCPEWPACQLCTLKTVCHPTYAQHSTKYWIYTRDMHVQYRYHTCLKNIGRHQKSLEHSPLICSLLGFLEFEWLNDLFIGWLLLAVAQNLKTGCLQTYKTHH